MEAPDDADHDAASRRLLALETPTPPEKVAISVVVRCRGVDASGRRCTRTRVVARTKLYRLPENKLFCHRHAPHTSQTQTTTRPTPWKAYRSWMVAVAWVFATVLVVVGIQSHRLWLCLLGLAAVSLASLCACMLVLEAVLRTLWSASTIESTTRGRPHRALADPSHSRPETKPAEHGVASIA